jgi:hypothetical protein
MSTILSALTKSRFTEFGRQPGLVVIATAAVLRVD